MFDIGFWELLVVALIGLIVLGPERLPRAIRSLQATVSKVRQFGSKMEAEINHELRVKELHDNLRKIENAEDLDNLPDELKKSLEELQRAAASVNRPYAKNTTSNDTPSTSTSAAGSAGTDAAATDAVEDAGNDRIKCQKKPQIRPQSAPQDQAREPRDDQE